MFWDRGRFQTEKRPKDDQLREAADLLLFDLAKLKPADRPHAFRRRLLLKITTLWFFLGVLRNDMKTKIITAFLLAASGFTPGVFGQMPSTPAPAVAASSTSD